MCHTPTEWAEGHDISKRKWLSVRCSIWISPDWALLIPYCIAYDETQWQYARLLLLKPENCVAKVTKFDHNVAVECTQYTLLARNSLILKYHFNLCWFSLFSMWYIGLGHVVISLASLACSTLLCLHWWCLASKLGCFIPTHSPHHFLLSIAASLVENISLFPHFFWPFRTLLDGNTAEGLISTSVSLSWHFILSELCSLISTTLLEVFIYQMKHVVA